MLTGNGAAAPFPVPLSPRERSASLRSDRSEWNSLDEIDRFTGESKSQRRFAPMVIAEDEIVDRFQLKSVIVPVKIRTCRSGIALDRIVEVS